MTDHLPHGLSPQQAAQRLAAEGPNELGVDQRRTLITIAGEVVQEPMFLLLLGADAIYLAMGDVHEAIILLGFVVIIMAITILQERRTEHALDALRDLSSPRALVIRGGEQSRIPGREVVRDDIVILVEGDRVPADGIVLQAHELAADESLLTGESEAVSKFPDTDSVFAGTLIVRGQGLVRVTATAGATELGRIGKSLQTIETESSPLRDEITGFTRRLAMIGAGFCILLALLYWLLRGGWLDALLAGITLAMGILPQEFPVIMIVFFAMGARRIARHQVLTRRLNAIETLGETTTLCVDKTGTLTQNRMVLAALCVNGEILDTASISGGELAETYHELLEYAVLASERDPHDPMELAFIRFARDYLANTEHLHPDWNLAREYELSPQLLAMSHLWRNDSRQHDVVATKGAPEAIADLCHMPAAQWARISADAERMADRGLRVLGVAKAHHRVDMAFPPIQHDFDFEFVGLVGLADPLREEVPEAVAVCHQAGIRVVMITGDHPRTALAIATQAGIDTGQVLTGSELATLAPDTLATVMRSVNVFARVTPQQKLTLVEAMKRNGEVVAMTGDGVNDAPALKAAHIGIAMGKRGTDVAREAAALILLQDNFAAIVTAIRLGRRIFANLRQAMIYTLAVHIPIIGLSILPVLFGFPLILTPIHIAFLELVIDPACSIVFEAEQGSEQLMERPPRPPGESLISLSSVLLSLVQGTLVTLVAIGAYRWAIHQNILSQEARALAFVILVVANALLILPSRVPQAGWKHTFSGLSRVGIRVLLGTLAGLLVVVFVPPVARAFAFAPLALPYAALAFLTGTLMLIPFQGIKHLFTRFHIRRGALPL